MPIKSNFQSTPGPRYYAGNRRDSITDEVYRPRHPSEVVVPQNGRMVAGTRVDQRFAPGNAITKLRKRLEQQ